MHTRPSPGFSWLLFATLVWLPSMADEGDVLVLTGLPVTYSLSAALAQGTAIDVRNIPDTGRRMNALENLLQRRPERFVEQFSAADAVVTIGKLWRDDPLFTAVRSANIRAIDIDATKPWSTTLEGVSVALQPRSDVSWEHSAPSERAPSVFFWLSLSNATRSADIIARDLQRLASPDSARIEENLGELRRSLLAIKREYEVKLAALADVTVFALASEFVYLTSDMGLYVDGYFLKQDIDWTEDDLHNLESYLSDHEIRVVLHKWEPDLSIRNAIDAAGAQLVVLDVIEAGIVEDGQLLQDSYTQLMSTNLEALYQALSAANASP